MERFKIEKDFIVDGFRCVIIGQRMGHRCGYIEIPKEHKLYGKDFREIDIDVHYGWTYSAYTRNDYPAKSDKDIWWIGFDCNHFGDAKDIELIKSFAKDEMTESYIEMAEILSGGVVRSLEYIENELINAVKQIKDM